MPSPLPRLRKLCLSLPETHEIEAWGAPTFRIKKGKIFAMYAHASTHHGDGRNAVWIKAMMENQQLMIRAEPDRYFSPPYTGPSGWIGVYLDDSTDWTELAALLKDGWQQIAPKKLLNATSSSSSPSSISKSTSKLKSKSKSKLKSKSKSTSKR